MKREDKLVVYGDKLLSDTRTVLACLRIGEVEYAFKDVNKNNRDQALGLADDKDSDYFSLAHHVPVIEDNGKKIMGSGVQIILMSALKDKRNAIKLDEKGKPIKQKKKKIFKSLYPAKTRDDMNRVLGWFLGKLRPYTQHLFQMVIQ